MTPQHHIIRRQVIEMTLLGEQDPVEAQQRMADLLENEIMERLDRVFSEISPEDEVIRINRLDIDIGRISLDDMAIDMTDRAVRSVRENILGHYLFAADAYGGSKQDGKSGNSTAHQPQGHSAIQPYFGKKDKEPHITGEDTAGSKRLPSSAAFMEVLIYFLKRGVLPWWSEDRTIRDMERKLPDYLERSSGNELAALSSTLEGEPARQRFIYQFTNESVIRVLETMAGESSSRLRSLVNGLIAVVHESALFTDQQEGPRFPVWNALITLTLSQPSPRFDEKHLILEVNRSLAKTLSHTSGSVAFTLIRTAKELSEKHSIARSVLESLSSALGGYDASERITDPFPLIDDSESDPGPPENRSGPDIRERCNTDTPPAHLESHDGKEGKIYAAPASGTQKDMQHGPDATNDDEGILDQLHIDNSGIVLVWPYLNRFFTNMGLVHDSEFISRESRMRAVQTLHFLACGTQEADECVLPLCKLLCGWDMGTPVRRDFVLSEDERTESAVLLKTVISHWPIIKNTTLEEFRNSFLQRNGLLTRRDDGWHLQVERKPYDMLLEHLPWGISMIRLFWMSALLRVEW